MNARTKRVLITCPPMLRLMDEFDDAFLQAGVDAVRAQTAQVLSEDELVNVLPDFDGWIIGDDPATRRVLMAGKSGRLKAAVKWGVGTDNVDFAAARALGLDIVNTPGVFGREVADLAMSYVVALARESFAIDRAIRDDFGWPKPSGISLAGRTLALVGFGDIGRQIARRALVSDMRVIVYDPNYKPDPAILVEMAMWPSRIDEADFLAFACPLNAGTRRMFAAALLPWLKPGLRVVNVARGPIIDEAALIEALECGIVHSAALDVFEREPLPRESRLREFPRCIFGSHNGSNTMDAVRRVSRIAIKLLIERLPL